MEKFPTIPTLVDNFIICEYLHRTVSNFYLSPYDKVLYRIEVCFTASVFLTTLLRRYWRASSGVLGMLKNVGFLFAWIASKLVFGSYLKRCYDEAVTSRYQQLIADNVDLAMYFYAIPLLLDLFFTKMEELEAYLKLKPEDEEKMEEEERLHNDPIRTDRREAIETAVTAPSGTQEKVELSKAQRTTYKDDCDLRLELAENRIRIADLQQKLIRLSSSLKSESLEPSGEQKSDHALCNRNDCHSACGDNFCETMQLFKEEAMQLLKEEEISQRDRQMSAHEMSDVAACQAAD